MWKDLGNNRLLFVILSLFSVYLLLTFVLSALRSPINIDAGYYLGVTELIHDGYFPIKDFGLRYTPLCFYILQIPRWFMGEFPDYSVYMLSLYLVAIIDAILLSSIIRRVTGNVKIAWFAGLSFLALYYYLDGEFFIIEAFSIFFGLLATTLLVEREHSALRCILAGACCALSFLAKQYGLLFFGFLTVLLLTSVIPIRKRLIQCLLIGLGGGIVLLFFVLWFNFKGVSIRELISSLSGSNYGQQSLLLYADGLKRCCKLFPYLFFLPCLFYCKQKEHYPLIWACLVGLFLASLQFFFNVFPHYYMYLLPFVFLLCALLLHGIHSFWKIKTIFLIYVCVLFTSIAIPLQTDYTSTIALIRHNHRYEQEQAISQLRQIVQDYKIENAFCFWNTIQFYGLCPLKPPAMQKYGYEFGYNTEEALAERLMKADCFLVSKFDLARMNYHEMLSTALLDNFRLLDKELSDGTMVYFNNSCSSTP